MSKLVVTISLILSTFHVFSQELRCKVVVSADQIVESNSQVFKTLETTISDFMNQTKWTNMTYAAQEKIDCSVLLTLVEKTGNNSYLGSIQVQSSRPVYNSIYTSPVLNYKDDDLSFSYTEFEPLYFDINSYQSELVSTLSFFAYLIIGLDADTFALNGGEEYFKTCQKIVDQVENPNSKKAWKSNTSQFNRYQFLNKINSPNLKSYHNVLYNYHLKGLDKMADNTSEGKKNIQDAIMELGSLAQLPMGSQIIRTFMDAKADEIVNIFSGGTEIDNKALLNALNRMAPTSANKWQKIK